MIYLQDSIYSSQKFPLFFKTTCLLLAIFPKFAFNQKEKFRFIWSQISDFIISKTFDFLSKKRIIRWNQLLLNSKNTVLKESTFNFSKILEKKNMKMNFFTGIFQEFSLAPLSGCFRLFQQKGFTRICIFLRKILIPAVFKCENTTLQTVSRGVLIH